MRASRLVAPKRLTSLDEAQAAFQRVQEQLDALKPRARGELVTSATTLIAGEYVRLSPRQGQVLVAKLPKANSDNLGQPITVSVERPNGSVRVSAEGLDTVNGASTESLTAAGLLVYVSNGRDAWVSGSGAGAGSPGTPGARGQIGPPGEPGPPGDPGDQGPPGAQGGLGPQGDRGFPGEPGEQGPEGDRGAQGGPGADGAQGPAGANGTPSVIQADVYDMGEPFILPGPAGAQGAAGTPGSAGAQGPAGPPGVDFAYPDAEPIEYAACTAQLQAGLPFFSVTEAAAGPFNDYAIPNLSTVDFLLLANAASQTWTGFAAAGGNREGYRFKMLVGSTASGTITQNNVGSIAANRTVCADNVDFPIGSRSLVEFEYFSGSWRLTQPTISGRLIVCTSYISASSGTHTFDARTRRYQILMIGGSGGGGGVTSATAAQATIAGEGASGAQAMGDVTTVPASVAYTVGAAGTAGTTAGTDGGAGGTTTWGAAATQVIVAAGNGGEGSVSAGGSGTTVLTARGGEAAGSSISNGGSFPTGWTTLWSTQGIGGGMGHRRSGTVAWGGGGQNNTNQSSRPSAGALSINATAARNGVAGLPGRIVVWEYS